MRDGRKALRACWGAQPKPTFRTSLPDTGCPNFPSLSRSHFPPRGLGSQPPRASPRRCAPCRHIRQCSRQILSARNFELSLDLKPASPKRRDAQTAMTTHRSRGAIHLLFFLCHPKFVLFSFLARAPTFDIRLLYFLSLLQVDFEFY